jgi:pimeloyl-ACP methyl ester carboxylesterase
LGLNAARHPRWLYDVPNAVTLLTRGGRHGRGRRSSDPRRVGSDVEEPGPRRPLEANLPHVRVPTLVVRGARDRIVPREWAEQVVALLPDGRLAIIPGPPHIVNVNAPERLEWAVLPFLAEGPAGPTS